MRLPVAFVGQNQIGPQGVFERHAAAERHFDRQFALRAFAQRLFLPIDAEEDDFIAPGLMPHSSRVRASGVPVQRLL